MNFSEKKSEANFRRLLEILDIGVDSWQPITQPTRFDKSILPDGSFSRSFFTNEYRETIERVKNFALKNCTLTASKKIYFFHGITQFGEERLAEYFKYKGYAVISPGKLTVDEQLNALINCESFVSTVGSCSHNSVFMRPGAEAILILRAANLFTGYQQVLDQVTSLNESYLDSSLSIFNEGNHYYCYIISEQLKRFFGDKFNGYEEDYFKIFLQYTKDSLSKGLKLNPKAQAYYDGIFPDFVTQLKRREDLIKAHNMPPNWENFEPPPPEGLVYQTHVGQRGWSSSWIEENQISNEVEKEFDLQAIKINFSKHKVYYSVYYNDTEGWSAAVANGETAGITGKLKSIFGVSVWLDEAGTKDFDILYRMHKFDGEWTPWAKNGEIIYSHGQKLNSIQIKLEPKN